MPQVVVIHGPEEATVACPGGGEARWRISGSDSGSDSATGDTVSTVLGINFVPAACGIEGSEGTNFVVDGNPGVDYSLSIRIVGFFDDFDFGGGLAGQVDWKVESRSGTCSMDLDLEAELERLANPPTTRTFLVGDACDHELNLDVSTVNPLGTGASHGPHTRNSL